MQKIVIITGATSGIGNYIAQQYSCSLEYTVICVDINDIKNIEYCTSFKTDLKNEIETETLFSKIPKIDLAINCAGVSSVRKELIEFSQEEIINSWQDNFLPTFNAMKNEIKIMQQHGAGKIINSASITGHIGRPKFLGYGSAKAPISNMTKVAAIEHANDNIRINSISPATIDTPMIRKKYNGELRDYSDVYHTKNCGTVDDIYSIVRMLESNNFMTGTDIKVDGGMTDLFKI